jgi:hypothetical protein
MFLPFSFRRPFARTPRRAPQGSRKAAARSRPQLDAEEDRLAPAVAVTGTAVVTSPSSPTLPGTVNPEGATVSAWFQYSTDRAFSPTLARTIGSGFFGPTGVAAGGAGDAFVADSVTNVVNEIKTHGTPVFTASSFRGMSGVAVDAVGDVFVADSLNDALQEVRPDGTLPTLASRFSLLQGVAVDRFGDVFVPESGHGAVKEILRGGAVPAIGPGFSARTGVSVDPFGEVFMADTGNNAVQELLPEAPSAPSAPASTTQPGWG